MKAVRTIKAFFFATALLLASFAHAQKVTVNNIIVLKDQSGSLAGGELIKNPKPNGLYRISYIERNTAAGLPTSAIVSVELSFTDNTGTPILAGANFSGASTQTYFAGFFLAGGPFWLDNNGDNVAWSVLVHGGGNTPTYDLVFIVEEIGVTEKVEK